MAANCTKTAMRTGFAASRRRSKNGDAQRSSRTASSVARIGTAARKTQPCVDPRDSRPARRLVNVPANSRTPGRSRAARPAPALSDGGGAGSHLQPTTIPSAVIGTLTRKIPCQPPTERASPPMVGPRAALTEAATDIAASACAGMRPPPEAARIIPRHDAGGDEPPKARREGRSGGYRERHGETGQEDAPGAEEILEPAHQRLADGAGQVEARDEPGRGAEVDVEIVVKRDEGDSDHRRVQRIQQGAEHYREDDAAGHAIHRLNDGED